MTQALIGLALVTLTTVALKLLKGAAFKPRNVRLEHAIQCYNARHRTRFPFE